MSAASSARTRSRQRGLLEHEGDGAGIEHFARQPFVAVGGVDDDPGLRRRLAKSAHEIGSGETGHAVVDEGQVGLLIGHGSATARRPSDAGPTTSNPFSDRYEETADVSAGGRRRSGNEGRSWLNLHTRRRLDAEPVGRGQVAVSAGRGRPAHSSFVEQGCEGRDAEPHDATSPRTRLSSASR